LDSGLGKPPVSLKLVASPILLAGPGFAGVEIDPKAVLNATFGNADHDRGLAVDVDLWMPSLHEGHGGGLERLRLPAMGVITAWRASARKVRVSSMGLLATTTPKAREGFHGGSPLVAKLAVVLASRRWKPTPSSAWPRTR
jgi:hypothetical protein